MVHEHLGTAWLGGFGCFEISASLCYFQPARVIFSQPVLFLASLCYFQPARVIFSQPVLFSASLCYFQPARVIFSQPVLFSASPCYFEASVVPAADVSASSSLGYDRS